MEADEYPENIASKSLQICTSNSHTASAKAPLDEKLQSAQLKYRVSRIAHPYIKNLQRKIFVDRIIVAEGDNDCVSRLTKLPALGQFNDSVWLLAGFTGVIENQRLKPSVKYQLPSDFYVGARAQNLAPRIKLRRRIMPF